VQPRLDAMRNVGLDTAKSGFPASLPREWGRLVNVQKIDATNYSMFLENVKKIRVSPVVSHFSSKIH
jgi:hypothetical protein